MSDGTDKSGAEQRPCASSDARTPATGSAGKVPERWAIESAIVGRDEAAQRAAQDEVRRRLASLLARFMVDGSSAPTARTTPQESDKTEGHAGGGAQGTGAFLATGPSARPPEVAPGDSKETREADEPDGRDA